LLRAIAILLLVVLVVRLVARSLRMIVRGRPSPSPTRPEKGQITQQLSQCPTCGTYFVAERGLLQTAGDTALVCSQKCRDAGRQANPPHE